MKKLLIAGSVVGIIIVVLISYYIIMQPSEVDINNSTGLEFIFLSDEGTIPQELCSERNLNDKIIVLEKKYCGACKIAVPRLREIEQELQSEFIYLDLSEEEDIEKLKDFKVIPKYTPTVLIGCNIYIGAYSKEEFKEAIESFLVSG